MIAKSFAVLLLTHVATAKVINIPFTRTDLEQNDKAGSVGLNDKFEISLTVGIPAKTYSVKISDITPESWLISCQCQDPQCPGHSCYNSAASFTFEPDGRTFSTDSAVGALVKERVTVAGFTLLHHAIGVAKAFKVDLEGDGLLGLGRKVDDGINKWKYPTILDSIMMQTESKMYSMWLDGQQGSLSFGGLDTTHCSPTVDYTPFIASDEWRFNIQRVQFGTYTSNAVATASTYLDEIVISGPSAVITEIRKVLGATDDGSNTYYVDCTKIGTFPNFVVTIGGKSYSVTHQQYIYKAVETDKCMLLINDKVIVQGGADWYLGRIFMKNICTVYDVGGNRFGLANKL